MPLAYQDQLCKTLNIKILKACGKWNRKDEFGVELITFSNIDKRIF